MTAWTKTVAAMVVVSAGALWWLSQRQAPPAPPPASIAAVPLAAGVEPSAAAPEATAGPDTARVEVGRVAAPAYPLATLCGRCVDAAGAPLPGCQVVLRGWSGAPQSMLEWQRAHADAPAWSGAVTQTTDASGRFELQFWPPPSFRFVVDAARADLVTISGGWDAIEAGARIDLGDVVFASGVPVTGRVVDEQGAEVARTRVTLRPRQQLGEPAPAAGQLRSHPYLQMTTDAVGVFASHAAMPPGDYGIEVADRQVLRPPHLLLAVDATPRPIEVVVATTDAAASIHGRVVDEAGQPVAAALVTAPGQAGASCDITTVHGEFTLRREAGGESGAVPLSVDRDGFEPPEPLPQVVWGAANVELQIASAAALRLRVIDAAGAAVDDFTVRMLQRAVSMSPLPPLRVRARGPFVDGTADIPGIRCGRWLLLVEFPSATKFERILQTIDVAAGARFVQLRAQPAATRWLRVTDADGGPVAGTHVQLCELFGAGLDDTTRVLGELDWQANTHDQSLGLLLFAGATDSTGSLSLSAAGGRDLGLRLLGPGHVPKLVAKLRLDEPGDLRVTVARGARLVGRVVPPTALAELKRLAGLEVDDAFPADRRPIVRLSGADGAVVPTVRSFADEAAWATYGIADDGSFAVGGLPPGAWTLQIEYCEVQGSGARFTARLAVAPIVLTEAATLHRDLDLQPLCAGTLEGSVTCNGEPLADARILLETDRDALGNQGTVTCETDAAGRFVHRGRAGRYRLRLPAGRDGRALRAFTAATVESGETVRHTFAILSGTLRVKLCDARGLPAAGIALSAFPDGRRLPLTNADGITAGEVTAQPTTVSVLPARLQSPAAQAQFWREGMARGETDPLAPMWRSLGGVTVLPAATATLELRLPDDWDR